MDRAFKNRDLCLKIPVNKNRKKREIDPRV